MRDLLNKSSADNNNNEKNSLLNKLLNKLSKPEREQLFHLFNKSYLIRPISIRKQFFLDYARLKEISGREDQGNESLTFCKAMHEFVERHHIPNPQSRLDRILEIGLPHKPRWQCCVENCRGKARYTLVLKNYEGKEELFQVCQRHKTWRHPTYKYIVRLKKLN